MLFTRIINRKTRKATTTDSPNSAENRRKWKERIFHRITYHIIQNVWECAEITTRSFVLVDYCLFDSFLLRDEKKTCEIFFPRRKMCNKKFSLLFQLSGNVLSVFISCVVPTCVENIFHSRTKMMKLSIWQRANSFHLETFAMTFMRLLISENECFACLLTLVMWALEKCAVEKFSLNIVMESGCGAQMSKCQRNLRFSDELKTIFPWFNLNKTTTIVKRELPECKSRERRKTRNIFSRNFP